LISHREATASSWRTWPKVKARRKEPNVDGAYAPASIPPTSAVTFNPAFAPKYPGRLRYSSARSPSLVFTVRIIAGTSSAADTRFVSSKVADIDVDLWKSCIYEMPLFSGRIGLW
jgi:hypothetical protein